MKRGRKYINYADYKLIYALSVILGAILFIQSLGAFAGSVRAARELIYPIPPYAQVIEVPKVIEVEKEVPVGCKTEKCRILAYIMEKFQDDAANAITMIRKCENSTFDQTRTNHNSNGTVDYGVMQINSIHIPKCGESIKTSWKANIDCGYKVYKNAKNTFYPWSCADVINQKSYKDSL